MNKEIKEALEWVYSRVASLRGMDDDDDIRILLTIRTALEAYGKKTVSREWVRQLIEEAITISTGGETRTSVEIACIRFAEQGIGVEEGK